MKRRKRKKHMNSAHGEAVELNVMPFIDIFSLLCTFLLFSAVFVTIGVLEVQIPFLSSAAPDTPDNKRELSIKIDVVKEAVEVTTSFTKAPIDQESVRFPRTAAGLAEMHTKLVRLRSEHKDTDKVTLFVDDEITYDELVDVLDEIKLRKSGDPEFVVADKNTEENLLYPKVTMGSVIL